MDDTRTESSQTHKMTTWGMPSTKELSRKEKAAMKRPPACHGMTKAQKPIYSAHEDTAGIHRNVMLMVMGDVCLRSSTCMWKRNGVRRQSPRRRRRRKETQSGLYRHKKTGDVLSAAALIPEQRERASKTPIKPPTE